MNSSRTKRLGDPELLARTQTIFEVSAIIEAFRETTSYRPRRLIPH